MSGGKGKIEDKDRTGGFNVNPQNINKQGAPISIRHQIREILAMDGKMHIKPEHVIKINDDGSVDILMPKKDMVAMKVMQLAMTGSGATTIRALQLIWDHLDGKPAQSVNVSMDQPINQIELSDEQVDKILEEMKPPKIEKK